MNGSDQHLMRTAVGGVVTGREVVEVVGADAASFLHGQVSQDTNALSDGESAWTFVLQPDGKVAVWGRVTRLTADRFVFDVDAGATETLVARLNRFKMRVDAAITPLDWSVVALRGPDTASVEACAAEIVADAGWPGVEGTDLIGPGIEVPDGVPVCSLEALEALRVEAGIPVMGRELTDKTIPAEAGVVERSVSFTKGCFTGQELAARIDSRGGNVPRHLRGLVIDGGPPPVDAEVVVDEKVVGSVTSSAESEALGSPVALAYVGRAVEPPASATVRWDGGEAPAEIRALPLVPLAG